MTQVRPTPPPTAERVCTELALYTLPPRPGPTQQKKASCSEPQEVYEVGVSAEANPGGPLGS